LIDKNFSNEKDVSEKYLNKLMGSIAGLFEEVGVRV